jgi:quercetin dioxygenase-like cupin family protein
MTIRTSRKRTLLAIIPAVLVLTATAYAAVSQQVGLGTIAYLELFGGPATVFMRTLTIAPNEVLGWHYHPGVGAYTIVTQGELVVEDGCGGETLYVTGDAFLEPPNRVHRGKNLTGGTVVTAQTFIVPAGMPTSVATTQLCGSPQNAHECKDGGWMNFNYPRGFRSQGDCQQYVITGE